jgi:hypothetical protein
MSPNRDYQRTDRGGADPAHRASRFLARVDRHLPTLANRAGRRAFLDRQLSGWEDRYARFIASQGRSEPRNSADPPQAADFLITITALAVRRLALGEHGDGGGDV